MAAMNPPKTGRSQLSTPTRAQVSLERFVLLLVVGGFLALTMDEAAGETLPGALARARPVGEWIVLGFGHWGSEWAQDILTGDRRSPEQRRDATSGVWPWLWG